MKIASVAALKRISKHLWIFIIGIPLTLATIIWGVFRDAIQKKLAPQADSILERCLAWGSRREAGWVVAAILLLAVFVQAISNRKAKTIQKDEEEEEQLEEESHKEAAAILKGIVGGIRESFETQRALWTQEKSSLIAHRDDIAEQAKSLEEKLHSLHADKKQYGEALDFLQWACAFARDQANRYAQQHLRTGMEAIKEIVLAPPTKRGDPVKFAEAHTAGIGGGEMPKGANRQAAYRLGVAFHCLMELYASVESLAAFPKSIFNDHFEHPELSVEELLDRWDERRHPETVILQVMKEVFEDDAEEPEVETDSGAQVEIL